ncbi:MAG: hypothetical protein IID32_12235 [Planctomycetes bacterium]|nr:hypothetical protein [Planctomycetota bacterium]
MKYYVVVLMYCFLWGVSQAQENQAIEVTGDPSREDDYYEKIVDLASLPATLPGHQRGPIDSGT